MYAAPSLPPAPALETAFLEARTLIRSTSEDPVSVLGRAAAPAEKIAAIDAIQRGMPRASQARRTTTLEALRSTAASVAEAPAVRARALTALGYSVTGVGDASAREAAVRVLLAATSGTYRVYALRGLGPATHDLTEAIEPEVQSTLLALLAGSLTEEERLTALLALDSFVRSREDLPLRRPDLVAALEASMLTPISADPAAFVGRGSASARSLQIAVVWHCARNRHSAGEPLALEGVNSLLAELSRVETDPQVRAEIAAFLAAPAPKLLR